VKLQSGGVKKIRTKGSRIKQDENMHRGAIGRNIQPLNLYTVCPEQELQQKSRLRLRECGGFTGVGSATLLKSRRILFFHSYF
jgi:hypothetical protein